VLGHYLGDGVTQSPLFNVACDPCRLGTPQKDFDVWLAGRQWAIVEVRRIGNVASLARRVEFHIQHPLRDDPALTGAGEAAVLDLVLKVEEDARRGAWVTLVNEDCSATQKVAVAFESDVDGRTPARGARDARMPPAAGQPG